MTRARPFAWLVMTWVVSGWAFAQDSTPWGVAELMGEFAAVERFQAEFAETKSLAILSQPLLQAGIIRYVRPDYLRRETSGPDAEAIEIQGRTLRIESSTTESLQLDLHDHPPILAFVESLRATLAGDLKALQRYYGLRLTGDRTAWTIELTPRDARFASVITSIVLHGSEAALHSMVTAEANGDRSELAFTKIEIEIE